MIDRDTLLLLTAIPCMILAGLIWIVLLIRTPFYGLCGVLSIYIFSWYMNFSKSQHISPQCADQARLWAYVYLFFQFYYCAKGVQSL
jgi:hypothetical protein